VNFHQLHVVLAIEEAGSFIAAARSLDTSQSNVSNHIAQLESELGVRLVDRGRHELTPEGQAVANRARRILTERDSIHGDLAQRTEPATGPVRIGMIDTTARWLTPPLLGALAARHPGIRLTVLEGSSTALQARLQADTLDAAVLQPRPKPGRLSLTPLFSEDLLLAAPAGQPLAARGSVDLDSLCATPLLLPPPGCAYRPDLDRAADHRGLAFTPLAELESIRLIASLTLDGHGPSILPTSAIPPWLRGRCYIRDVPGLPQRPVTLATRTGQAPVAATAATITLLEELVAARLDPNRGLHPPPEGDGEKGPSALPRSSVLGEASRP
jgi:DNA-binding transcriptional LysR family regulator